MIKRLFYFILSFPLVAFMGVMIIISLFYWLITGKDLLWVVNKLSEWLNKKIHNTKV